MRYDFDNDKSISERQRARRSIEREKARKKRLFARRATIVTIIALILILIIALVTACCKAVFSSFGNKKEETTAPTVAATEAAQELTFVEPDIPDDKDAKGYFSSTNGAVYIYDGMAFELFSGTEDSARDYADCISDFKASVGDDITVYNMVIPNHIEFGLPRRFIKDGTVQTNSQSENIKAIYSSYSEDVIPINCYNALSEHCDEYIYFNTDHHWTGLGAYYAYQAFCEQTDNKILDLSVCTERVVDGYEGSLIDCDGSLYENLDSVHYWEFPYNTYGMRTENMGETPYETSVYYSGATSGPYTYGVFIWGDCPLFVEHNADLTNGKKIAVVKESYGNAFVPYLTANYEQVHVIDFRYFDGNLKQYCTDNGIDEVLFVNNILAANTAIQVDRIRTLID